MIILIPLPLFFSHHVYGTGGLTAWVVVGIIWTFLSAFCVVLYPLYESRVAIGQILRGIVKVRSQWFCYSSVSLTLDCRIFSRWVMASTLAQPLLLPERFLVKCNFHQL